MTTIINTINTVQTKWLQKPIMEEVELCNYFKHLPKEEKEWFYSYKNSYLMGIGLYAARKAKKLFVEEYNEQLKDRAKRKYEVAMMQYEKQMELQKVLGFHAVEIKEYSECGTHCNKICTDYSFSRSITKQEFISFLEKMSKEIISRSNWWRNYTIIKGEGDKWIYINVMPCGIKHC